MLPGLLIAAEFTLLERPRPARGGSSPGRAGRRGRVVPRGEDRRYSAVWPATSLMPRYEASVWGDRVLTMLAIVPQWIRLLLFPGISRRTTCRASWI